MAAGVVGVAAMTVVENLEQACTRRPDSHVPGLTLGRLMGLPDWLGRRSRLGNLAMHTGQGVLLGGLRGVMAASGLKGPWASGMFFAVRLTNDQVLENATGVGAPPWTWPREELVIDLVHKAVYAFVTGAVADRLLADLGPGGAHAAIRPGRHGDVGPPPRGAGLRGG